jgi:23S rRNA (cytosine1962-C5)-methyltransferase
MNTYIDSGDYTLIDSGNGRKLERFGKFIFSRPCAAAVWAQSLTSTQWDKADGVFDRDGGNAWTFNAEIPATWNVVVGGISFKLSTTGFGHVGMFPEQVASWKWIQTALSGSQKNPPKVLNLFAYSGGATMAAALAGASVCHLDASRGMTQRARENADLNNLANAPIRWIVDDVMKFLDREIRRGNTYDAIIMDPPSFGRGKAREVFKIERAVMDLMAKCRKLLSNSPRFVLFSCHTPSFTPATIENILTQSLPTTGAHTRSGELMLTGKRDSLSVPSGTYGVWQTKRGKSGGSR